MRRNILSILLILLVANGLSGQETASPPAGETDSISTSVPKESHKQKVARRNFHYNILGGPGYTPDFGFTVGGSALMTFRMHPNDTLLQRSVIPVAIAFMFEGGGINLFSKPQLFFKGDRFRIFGKFSYKNTVENFYGVGYRTNRDYIRSDSTSSYSYSGIQINPWFLFRLGRSNFFAGPQIDLNYERISDPANALYDPANNMDPAHSYLQAGGTENGYKVFSSGIGFLFTYDSRDVPANAYRGMYLDIRGMAYSKVIGSDQNFYRLEIDYRQYKSLGQRKVLAWTVQTKNVFGDVPLTQYSLTGSPFDLRGYYMGQYRDKSSHVAMAEYRQMINTSQDTWIKRMLCHIGFVVWAGCGFMGPTMGKIEGVLPNFGAGLRIEVQPRMNVRLDLGKNTVNNQTLFYFNITEAF